MARRYITDHGYATAYRWSNGEYLVRAIATGGDTVLTLKAYRDDAGFAGRDWRVSPDYLYPQSTITSSFARGNDQFASLRDIAEEAIEEAHKRMTREAMQRQTPA